MRHVDEAEHVGVEHGADVGGEDGGRLRGAFDETAVGGGGWLAGGWLVEWVGERGGGGLRVVYQDVDGAEVGGEGGDEVFYFGEVADVEL